MRINKKLLSVTLLILVFTAVLALSVLGGCQPKAGVYYLSEYKDGAWTRYSSDSLVPQANKFVQDEQNADEYHLTIELAQGDKVRVARVNSTETFGADELFGSLAALTSGEDNALVVAQEGKFEFTFDAVNKEISVKFTANTQGQDPDCKCEECGDDCECKDCDGEDCQCHGSDGPSVSLVEISGVTGSSFTLTFPATKQLEALAFYEDGTSSSSNIKWASSNESVATVSNGLVTSVSAGTAQITAKCGGVESDPITVTVNGTATLSESTLSLNIGHAGQLTATLAGGATAVGWGSDNEGVATVEGSGTSCTITPVSAGTATISFDYLERPGTSPKTVTCEVAVNTPVESISINSALTVAVDDSETLTVTISPSDATNQNFSFDITQSDTFISVDKNGSTLTVHGVAAGTATITVTSEDGNHTAQCVVTVVAAGEAVVNINTTSVALNLGTNTSQTLSITVQNGTASSITWAITGGSAVATLSSTSGSSVTVTSAGFGTATVTATVNISGGSSVTRTCTVFVAPDNFFLYTDNGSGTWVTDVTTLAAKGWVFSGSEGIYTLTVDLTSGQLFRIGNDDNFTTAWDGIGYTHGSSSTLANMSAGSTDNNLQCDVKGNYTITVDLTGTTPKLSIVCNSVAVTSVTLSNEGDLTLQAGQEPDAFVTILVAIGPSNATYTNADIVWIYIINNIEYTLSGTTFENDNFKLELIDSKQLVVTIKEGAESGTVSIKCKVKDFESDPMNITLVAKGADVVAPTEITFTSNGKYYFDVASSNWTSSAVVSASVDEAASNQGVTYSCSASYFFTISGTGAITLNDGAVVALGTYTITATADGDNNVTANATVTFYSSQMWMASSANSWKGSYSSSIYNFTDTNNAHEEFTLQIVLTNNTTFQIIFTTAGAVVWDSAVNRLGTLTSSVASASGDNILVSGTDGIYTITVNLSEETPLVTVVRTSDMPTYQAKIMKGSSEFATSGDSTYASGSYSMDVDATFDAADYTIQIGGTQVTISSISGDDGFTLSGNTLTCTDAGEYRLTILYNADDNTCTVTVEAIAAGWVIVDTYGIQASVGSNWGASWSNSDLSSTVYYSSADNKYEAYFTFAVPASSNFCFGLMSGGTWNTDIKDTSIVTNNCSYVGSSKGGGNFWTNSTGTAYFKLEFTVASGTVTLTALTISSSAFTQPTT